MREVKLKKLNILDIALLILVIALILGAYLKINSKQLQLITTDAQNAYIEIRISEDDNKNVSKISKGNDVFYYENGEKIGIIEDITDIYKDIYLTDENGNPIISESDRPIGVNIKVKAEIKADVTGNYVNSKHFIAPGMDIEFSVGTNKSYIGKVYSVSLKNN